MSAQSQNNHTSPLVVLTTLFFMMGFITCMNDILIPHLKEIFDLSYVQAMLIQFCFFTAYAVMSIPMGAFVGKVGYKNGVIGGFLLTAVGCLLFYPAAGSHSYAVFLGALFILASGVTLLQVAGNPYVTLLAKPGKESATLTLVQAFNALGTTIAPQIGAFLILADATQTVSKAEQISSVQIPYLGLAGLLIILAVFVKMIRLPDARKIAAEESAHNHDGKTSVWQYKHLVFGTAGIFCYVGAEVSIGSLMVNVLGYLKGLDHASAAHYLSFYWDVVAACHRFFQLDYVPDDFLFGNQRIGKIYQRGFRCTVYRDCRRCGRSCRAGLGGRYLHPDVFVCRFRHLLSVYRVFCGVRI